HHGGEKMFKQILGTKSSPPSESIAGRLAQATRIGAVLSGFAVAAALSTPAAAQSLSSGPCASTIASSTFFQPSSFTPFAAGGGINTLVSAINVANTAFLSQSTAFIGSPPNPDPNQLGGGVWSRGIGGQTDFKSTSTSTFTF